MFDSTLWRMIASARQTAPLVFEWRRVNRFLQSSTMKEPADAVTNDPSARDLI